jgi:hypothetical protein
VERAETVLDRSTNLAANAGPHDIGGVGLHLLRIADHDPTTLDHALHIGRTRVRREPARRAAYRAVELLESVIAFLGHKPRNGD